MKNKKTKRAFKRKEIGSELREGKKTTRDLDEIGTEGQSRNLKEVTRILIWGGELGAKSQRKLFKHSIGKFIRDRTREGKRGIWAMREGTSTRIVLTRDPPVFPKAHVNRRKFRRSERSGQERMHGRWEEEE